MKKHFLVLASLLAFSNEALIAQQIPTPYTTPFANTPAQAVTTANAAWYRGGNSPGGTAGNANIFGTMWNSPIYTVTNGINRMKLNGNFTAGGASAQYLVNGFGFGTTINTINTTGYLLLGANIDVSQGNTPIYTTKGAFSMLHLNGSNQTIVQEEGYRPWMKTGITFTDNRDMAYLGLRQLGTGTDITEMVINWSDNQNNANPGPDDMVFRFTSQGQGNTAISEDRITPTDLDGLHVARFAPTGQFGLGNTFGINEGSVQYVRPQSLFHMSYDWRAGAPNDPFGFMQITYRHPGNIAGSGETVNDGLRFGIDNTVVNGGLNGFLRWQENTPFIIQTDWNNAAGGIQQGERVRFTSVGSLVTTQGPGYGGLTTPTNRTRIAISADGANPITRPLSLLHLGFNTGAVAITPGTDGWRPWMDLGIFTTNGSDNVYLGLKQEMGPAGDRQDAVLSWGDNQTSGFPPGNGPDNFRMIFTSTTAVSGGGTPPATGANGLEGMRMTPTTATGVFTGIGGDPTNNQYGPAGNSFNPTATLEVNSWGATNVAGGSSGLRFTNLNSSSPAMANPGQGVLSVDAEGDVVYVQAPITNGDFGAACNDNINGKLQFDTKLDMNNYNLYFTNSTDPMNLNENRLGLGYICGTNLPGKIAVRQLHDQTVSQSTTAGHFYNSDIANVINLRFFGVNGRADGIQPPGLRSWNIGGSFSAENADINIGVLSEAKAGFMSTSNNMGGSFNAGGGSVATGVNAQGTSSQYRNIGVYGIGTSPSSPSLIENIGGQFVGAYSAETNYGVRAVANFGQHSIGIYGAALNGSSFNHAGYFNGNIEVINGTYISDQQFKINVEVMSNGLRGVLQLKPVKYNFATTQYPQFNFGVEQQFGFIAQEVETVFPNLVYQSELPAQYDSIGNEITPATPYKSLNYNGLIPINTQAIIELNQKIDRATLSDESIKTNVINISNSLNKVLEMRGVSYDWNHTIHPELNLDSVNHVGFIAQEIQLIDPRLTYLANDSLLHVEYDKVVPILAEAIEELNNKVENRDSIISAQQASINDLNNRLSQLENCLSGILPLLCQLNQSTVKANTLEAQEEVRKNLSVTLNNRSAIVLDQNVPNPFAEQTIINFSIPETVQKAQIHFYDANGRFMNSIEITDRGLGSITVFGSDLSTGVYTYTLVADGQVVATKKMMKQ